MKTQGMNDWRWVCDLRVMLLAAGPCWLHPHLVMEPDPVGGGSCPCGHGELSAQHFLGKVILFSNAGTGLFLMAMLLISLRKQIALPSGENFWVAASYHPVAPAAESVLGTYVLPRSFLGLTLYLLPQFLPPLTGTFAIPASTQTLFFLSWRMVWFISLRVNLVRPCCPDMWSNTSLDDAVKIFFRWN